MLNFKFQFDDGPLRRQIAEWKKQLRYAAARGLTQTARDAQAAIQQDMRRNLQAPTPYALRAVKTIPANKQNLQAVVYIDDKAAGSGASPVGLIGQQFTGGARGVKVFEARLRQAGLLASGEFTTPGAAARIDARGNMYVSDLRKILAAIKAGPTTASKRSRSKLKGRIVWLPGPKPAKGAYVQDGRTLKPLLRVVRQPRYKQRVDMLATVQKVVKEKWATNFDKAWADAVRTAK